jgi:translation initiation factor IF-2
MTKIDQTAVSSRPPIVAVLGHVDHGKTSLLDTIRKADVAGGEHGGITQQIGAYQIALDGKPITFIDTPGHEAFAKMRSRGANVADVALLVVAADDSVKPQTKESIEQIQAAGVSMIVVVNKVDLPTANIDKVKQDLARNGVQVEGFGGDIPMALVSAKAKTGIKELLDLIVLVSQMKELKGDSTAPFEGVAIETRVDKGKGLVSSIIVKNGTLKAGTTLYEGPTLIAKVRSMFDEHGVVVKEALPSRPVEVLGFTSLPSVGAVITDAPKIVTNAPVVVPKPALAGAGGTALPDWLKPVSEQEKQKLNIVLKGDTAGSLEAIQASLSERIKIVSSSVGDISEADILLARGAKAFVIGFNVKCPGAVAKLAQTEKVVYRTYNIIYELLEEMEDVVSGMKEVLGQERELGEGAIIAEFPFEKSRIAGTKIISGRLARGDSIKIMRDEGEIGRAKIKSIRKGREEVTKVEEGIECGVLLDREVAFALNDVIIAVTTG